MICPSCGYENKEGAKFCGKCGDRLAQPEGSLLSAAAAEEQTDVKKQENAGNLANAENQPPMAAVEDQKDADSQPSFVSSDRRTTDSGVLPEAPIAVKKADRKDLAGKKKLKTGKFLLAGIAVICLAAGFFGGRALTPKKYEITREQNYDTYTLSMAAGFTYDGVSDTGTVEILGPQGTVLDQIKGVKDDSYRILDSSGKIIYLDEKEQLCEQTIPKGEKHVLAGYGDWDTVWVSEDGGYVTYLVQADGLTETMVYDLAEGKPKRVTDGMIHRQYMDTEDKTLYYLDEAGALYQYKQLSERNRIKGDVAGYQVLSSEPVVLWLTMGEESISCGITWGEDEQRLKEFQSISKAAIHEDSHMMVFLGCKEDEIDNSLYFCGKDQEPVEAYSDIADFFYADHLNELYYRTSDGTLYHINLEPFDEETLADSSRLKGAVKALVKEKLSSDALQMKVSANGEHLAWITSDGELHYRHFQSDKDIVLGEQVKDVQVFDQSLYSTKEDGQLTRYVYPQGETVKVENAWESSAGTIPVTTLFGDCLAAATEDAGTLQVLDRINGRATLVPDMTAYDKVSMLGQNVYGKQMEYSQIQGTWKLKDKDILLTFQEDNILMVYEIPDLTQAIDYDNEEKKVTINPTGITKFRMDIGAQEEVDDTSDWAILTSTASVILGDEGSCSWKSSEGSEPILMEPVTEGQIQTLERKVELALNYEAEAAERSQYIAAERERAEERRREEERKRQEEQAARNSLNQRARSYYNSGIYLSSGTYYYSSPNMGSRTSRYISTGMRKSVYQYQVDFNSSIIWLKVRGSDGKYYWVYTR